MKEFVGRFIKNKRVRQAGLVASILGAAELGSRIIPQNDILQAVGGTTPRISENAAGINKQFIPLIINPMSAPTPTPTLNTEITPTPTSIPFNYETNKGVPSLSIEDHLSLLTPIEQVTNNGISVGIWKTNQATVLMDLDDSLKSEWARIVAENAAELASTPSRAYDTLDMVLCLNLGDMPVGTQYNRSTGWSDSSGTVYPLGRMAEGRSGSRYVFYLAAENLPGLTQGQKDSRDKAVSVQMMVASKIGTTNPTEGTRFDTEEQNMVRARPYRFR